MENFDYLSARVTSKEALEMYLHAFASDYVMEGCPRAVFHEITGLSEAYHDKADAMERNIIRAGFNKTISENIDKLYNVYLIVENAYKYDNSDNYVRPIDDKAVMREVIMNISFSDDTRILTNAMLMDILTKENGEVKWESPVTLKEEAGNEEEEEDEIGR